MAMADDAANGGIAITPSDVTNLQITSGIYIGGAGTLTVSFSVTTPVPVLFTAPAVGFVLPLKVRRIYATGTTATGIVALY